MSLPNMTRPEWQTEAACLGAPDVIFVDPKRPEDIADAKAICVVCPVRRVCATFALALEDSIGQGVSGVYGGYDEHERRAIRRRRGVRAKGPGAVVLPVDNRGLSLRHGTYGAYVKAGCRCIDCDWAGHRTIEANRSAARGRRGHAA